MELNSRFSDNNRLPFYMQQVRSMPVTGRKHASNLSALCGLRLAICFRCCIFSPKNGIYAEKEAVSCMNMQQSLPVFFRKRSLKKQGCKQMYLCRGKKTAEDIFPLQGCRTDNRFIKNDCYCFDFVPVIMRIVSVICTYRLGGYCSRLPVPPVSVCKCDS